MEALGFKALIMSGIFIFIVLIAGIGAVSRLTGYNTLAELNNVSPYLTIILVLLMLLVVSKALRRK